MSVKVRERPKGSKVWWVFIHYQGRRKSKKIGKDKKLALEIARKIEAKLVLGQVGLRKPECPRFREYAEIWLSLPHGWKDSTLESYRDNLRIHVFPVFGKQRLDQIRRKDLKGFFDSLLIKGSKSRSETRKGKGLSFATVNLIRAPMAGVLSYAVDSEVIETNPLSDLKLRYRKKALEVEPLTEEQAGLLLSAAKVYLGGYYYPHMLCALRTGMRIGELQALQWGDLDFHGRFINVKRSWRKGRLTDTKNKKRRQIDMTPHLTETLRALRVAQKKRALKNGRPVSDWIFANQAGEMLNRVVFEKALNRCLESARLCRIRVHDLRHTYATIRLLRGHNIGDVSYQLGHSSISITYDVYGHWVPGRFKSEVDDLDMPIKNATQAQPTPASSQVL